MQSSTSHVLGPLRLLFISPPTEWLLRLRKRICSVFQGHPVRKGQDQDAVCCSISLSQLHSAGRRGPSSVWLCLERQLHVLGCFVPHATLPLWFPGVGDQSCSVLFLPKKQCPLVHKCFYLRKERKATFTECPLRLGRIGDGFPI